MNIGLDILIEELQKEVIEYNNFCEKLFSVRYEDAKHEDRWYDELQFKYQRSKTRIEFIMDLILKLS